MCIRDSLNLVLLPWMEERQIKEVDYGTFMTMTEEKDIGRVDIESNPVSYTHLDVYKRQAQTIVDTISPSGTPIVFINREPEKAVLDSYEMCIRDRCVGMLI